MLVLHMEVWHRRSPSGAWMVPSKKSATELHRIGNVHSATYLYFPLKPSYFRLSGFKFTSLERSCSCSSCLIIAPPTAIAFAKVFECFFCRERIPTKCWQ